MGCVSEVHVTDYESVPRLHGCASYSAARWFDPNLGSGPGEVKLAFPKATVFLVTTVAALAAMACFIGAYTLGVRVRYVSTRASTGAQPGMPPA